MTIRAHRQLQYTGALMESSSRPNGVAGRVKIAATNLYSENQSLVTDIRKALATMKDVAVDWEKDGQSDMVKELEDAVVELLESSNDCANFSSALQTVGNEYQPSEQLSDFDMMFNDEVSKVKSRSNSSVQDHPFLRQFREAIWNVNHAGQPMPGEDEEDIVITSTQCTLLNITCPLSGKPVIELADPVRSVVCKHVYDKKSVMQYISSKNARARCPVAACPKILQADKVICDPLLPIEIEEVRSLSRQSGRSGVVEDFTGLDED